MHTEANIQAVEAHVCGFFTGHLAESVSRPPRAGRPQAPPDLRLLTIAPGPRIDSWTYITAGCWNAAPNDHGHGVEFVLSAPVCDESFAELLTMVASYHLAHRLDLHHALPIGRPWVPGSACDHLLISLPYLHGPDLEHCPLPGGHARLLWTLPVTAAEVTFRREHGHEALEQRFDQAAIIPTDPARPSVA
ncbi:suppressor of fused domain protein [Actinomadura harenae]|uniref:Suppressor of fused domain protein n=1 Tax=Actinomadura harenae TaxID=2483351 RepID=A0A3M2M624_9ACTN|nr:suppressor of fused domain protein [Actinomadura harenae]RMI44929.1 suppressor of fused domain protein [Actinomadura harenae]